MRRPRQALAAALLLPLLAACGGAPQASNPPTAARSSDGASKSAEPTPEPVPLTKAGARAFVGEYIDTLNEAMASGVVAPVERLDDGSCQSCTSTLGAIRQIYSAGGNIEGGQWTPQVLQALRRPNGWVIDVRIDFEPQEVTRRSGAKAESFDGGDGLASFILRDVSGEWRVDEWTRAN